MITLSKSGSTVTFTFDENSGYLQNGTIDVPVNSLSLIIDESDMATFRKAASNDIFISARYDEFGMSKADLEAWYKANMVSSGGGGGGGVTPSEVQSMIDESISGKADADDVYTIEEVDNAISAATDDMATKTWVGEQGYLTEHQSLSAYSTTEEVNSAITEATSGKVDTSTYNTYTANTATEINNKLAVSDFNTYSGAVDTAINSKASESDLSALTDVVSAHTANTDIHVTTAQTAAWNAKADVSDIPSVSGYADSVKYNSTSKYVEFYHGGTGGTKVFEYDASPFLIDGMVQNVEIKNVPITETVSTADTAYTFTSGATTEFIIKVKDNWWLSSNNGVDLVGGDDTYAAVIFPYNGSLQIDGDASGTSVGNTIYVIATGSAIYDGIEIVPDWSLYDSVEAVYGYTTCLVISFNTDAGKQDINIPLTDIFDPSNYYTKNEIDAELSGKADSSAVTEEISAAVSGKVDTSTFNTYSGSVETALSGKQDTLSAGTNITIVDNVISAEGGGKAVSGGTNISITTGETADTINCTLPYYKLNGSENYSIYGSNTNLFINKATNAYNSIFIGTINEVKGDSASRSYYDNFVIGDNNIINGHITAYYKGYNVVIGSYNMLSGTNLSYSYVIGKNNSGYTSDTLLAGWYNKTYNSYESAFGKYNNSNTGSTDADKTLFSVGNGTADNARHNALEIRQNGDIYISSGGTDIKLQDQLGGGGMTEDDELLLATALTDLNDRKIDATEVNSNYQRKGDYATKTYVTTALEPYETKLDEINTEEVASYALNDLNERLTALETAVQALQALHNNE